MLTAQKEPERCGLTTVEGRPVPLHGVEVSGTVAGGVAQLAVRQRYRNAEPKPIEAVYTFPLPSDATLTGFSMTCAGRTLTGVVKEREEAFRAYDEAVSSGHGAALLDAERPNVFTAQVGNLLPGEETLIELTYVQRLEAEEGALRLAIPTLVAPRYIPGSPSGDRTGGGFSEPTDRVPDADRITPAIGKAPYGLRLDLVADLGEGVTAESPSHALLLAREVGGRLRISLSGGQTALDRDLVLVLSRTLHDAERPPLTTVVAHRGESGPGVFALTVVPDLAGELEGSARTNDVVFVLDVSGSMAGTSLPQAVAALRLCLRHLRRGDRFNVIAFSSDHTSFRPALLPFDEEALRAADRWIGSLQASGGTEMLEPLLAAVRQAPDGSILLLTDGQVGNEDEILKRVLGERGTARVFSFGIGTNVSDALLRGLARETGGAVEGIYPGERIDEKVVAQFSRATADRVADLRLTFRGVAVQETAPAETRALVDAEPWFLTGRYEAAASGSLELAGTLRGKPWSVAVPLELPERADRPYLTRLWAQERVRDLLAAQLQGRRANAMKDRIVALAVEHGLATPYTSFVVVEERTGERRATGQPETRTVPVHTPHGWAMLQQPAPPIPVMLRSMAVGAAPAARSMPCPSAPQPSSSGGGLLSRLFGKAQDVTPPAPTQSTRAGGLSGFRVEERAAEVFSRPSADPALELLSRQLASGLWQGASAEESARATAGALATLFEAGITGSHRLHGPQVRKAVEALLEEVPRLGSAARKAAEAAGGELRELVLLVAWLVSSGRLRRRVEEAAARLGIVPGDEPAARRRVKELRASR